MNVFKKLGLKEDFDSIEKKDRQIFILALILTLIGAFFIFWSFNYIDGQSIMAWSVNNWDLLVEGRWKDFYLDKAINLRGAAHSDMTDEGMISPFIYLAQSIWCLPIWLTHYFNGNLYVGTIGCVYWYKLFLFLVTVVTAYYCHRITKRISGDAYSSLLAGFLVLASSEVMLSTGYAGQDEIVYLCAMMISLDCLMRDKIIAFVLLSMYVVTLCPIMIIAVMPMLLIKEKNILKILAYAVVMFLPMLFWELVSSGMEQKFTATTMADQLKRTLDYIQIPIISGTASVMVIAVLVVYFYAFITKPDVSDKKLLWISTLLMVYMSFFNDNLFYRSLLYVPFVAILIACEAGGNIDIKLFLMTVLTYVRFFALGIDSPMHMNTRYTKMNTVIVAICRARGSDKYEQSDPLVTKIFEKAPGIYPLKASMNGVCVAAILILLWITYSERNEKAIAGYRILDKRVLVVLYGMCMLLYMIAFYAVIFY